MRTTLLGCYENTKFMQGDCHRAMRNIRALISLLRMWPCRWSRWDWLPEHDSFFPTGFLRGSRDPPHRRTSPRQLSLFGERALSAGGSVAEHRPWCRFTQLLFSPWCPPAVLAAVEELWFSILRHRPLFYWPTPQSKEEKRHDTVHRYRKTIKL